MRRKSSLPACAPLSERRPAGRPDIPAPRFAAIRGDARWHVRSCQRHAKL